VADIRKLKLGFVNPLQPGSDDISFDPFDLQDPASAHQIISAQEDVFKRRNVFKGMTEFVGLVILKATEIPSDSGLIDRIAQAVGQQSKFYRMKVHIPELHAALGNPCDIGYLERSGSRTQQEKVSKAEKVIEHHPWFITKLNTGLFGQDSQPVFGDIIKVKFTKGPSSGRQIEGEIVGIISSGENTSIKSICDSDVLSTFKNYDPNVSNSSKVEPVQTLDTAQQKILDNCRETIKNVEITDENINSYFNIFDISKFKELDQTFQQNILNMAKDYYCVKNTKVNFVSGKRTYEQQKALYNGWITAGGSSSNPTVTVVGYGSITTPANPDTKGWKDAIGHQTGKAIDCGSSVVGGAEDVVRTLGGLNYYGLKWGGEFSTPDRVHIESMT
jgi:hypothetical protein